MNFVQLWLDLFYVFVQELPKNDNYEDFWTKLVNTNNYRHYFLHGLQILQGVKITASLKKYLKPEEKKNFSQGRWIGYAAAACLLKFIRVHIYTANVLYVVFTDVCLPTKFTNNT